jgi:UTP--glucose-1-phosphate uridylyltransferase
VRQGAPLGLGHAVLMAAQHVGSDPFAVLLGDDLIDPRNPVLDRMAQVRQRYGGSVLCLMEVPGPDISLYGCAAVEVTDEADVVHVTGLVEKPLPDEAPSSFAIIGRYLLDPAVFGALRATKPGKGGEIQLTDAIAQLIDAPAESGGGVRGIVFRGQRYDTGDRHSYLTTVIRLACEREDLGPRLRSWLLDYVSKEMPNP